MILTRGKIKSRETCSNDTLSTIKPVCADPSLKPVVCDEKSVNNDLDLEAVTLIQCSVKVWYLGPSSLTRERFYS